MILRLCEIPFANPEYCFLGISVYSCTENLENGKPLTKSALNKKLILFVSRNPIKIYLIFGWRHAVGVLGYILYNEIFSAKNIIP